MHVLLIFAFLTMTASFEVNKFKKLRNESKRENFLDDNNNEKGEKQENSMNKVKCFKIKNINKD